MQRISDTYPKTLGTWTCAIAHSHGAYSVNAIPPQCLTATLTSSVPGPREDGTLYAAAVTTSRCCKCKQGLWTNYIPKQFRNTRYGCSLQHIPTVFLYGARAGIFWPILTTAAGPDDYSHQEKSVSVGRTLVFLVVSPEEKRYQGSTN